MKKDEGKLRNAAELRRRAEERLRAQRASSDRTETEQDLQRLVHELQVHQIELEMQNEELLNARAEVETALKRYTDLYDFAPVGYFAFGRDGEIRQVNLTGARLLGVERSRLVGRRFGLDICETERPVFDAFLKAAFGSSTNAACEVAIRRAGTFPLVVSVEAVVAEDGQECRAMVADITERKRTEAVLAETAAELVRSNADLEHFAYVASHDLQEPLRTVTGYMRLLKQRYEGKLDATADEFIGFAVDGVTRMGQLINDLLAYSRIGRRGEESQPIDANDVVKDVLDTLQFTIGNSHAVVTHDSLPTVRGDATQLTQLFQNLVGNAIKFRGQAPPRIHIGVRPAEEMWEFSVSDNGIGMDPQHFDRIFVMFQRLNTQAQYPGTGIGLAICKRIVECHGGRMWVESEPGRGTTFHFSLPAASGPSSA